MRLNRERRRQPGRIQIRRNNGQPAPLPTLVDTVIRNILRGLQNPYDGVLPPAGYDDAGLQAALQKARAIAEKARQRLRLVEAYEQDKTSLFGEYASVLGDYRELKEGVKNHIGWLSSVRNSESSLTRAVQELEDAVADRGAKNPPNVEALLALIREAQETICQQYVPESRGSSDKRIEEMRRDADKKIKDLEVRILHTFYNVEPPSSSTDAPDALIVRGAPVETDENPDEELRRLKDSARELRSAVRKYADEIPDKKSALTTAREGATAAERRLEELKPTYERLMTYSKEPSTLDGYRTEVVQLLSPYWRNMEAVSLIAEARRWISKSLGSPDRFPDSLRDPKPEKVTEEIDELSELEGNLNELLAKADAAIAAAEKTLGEGAKTEEQKRDEAGKQALVLWQKAVACAKQIKKGPTRVGAKPPLSASSRSHQELVMRDLVDPRVIDTKMIIRYQPIVGRFSGIKTVVNDHARSAASSTTPPTGLVQVPDVVGLPGVEAKKRIEKAGFTPQFQLGKGAPQAEQKHFVYEQSPEAETRAKLPTSVRLTIYGEPRVGRDALIVPNVVERSAIEARSILRKAGFQPKLSVGQAAPSKEKNLYVYRQQPRAGESAARGGVVDITIYRTVSESVGRHTEPVPGLRRVATLTGQWKCSCGETWTLTQRGSKITGQEGTSGSIRHITRGAFDGSVVRFSWRTTDGQSGTGVMVPNAEKRQISWTMTLDSTGQSWKGKAQKKP